MNWKNHIRLTSRAVATYLFLLPIAGSVGMSRAILSAGMAALLYLIICCIADGRDKNSAD